MSRMLSCLKFVARPQQVLNAVFTLTLKPKLLARMWVHNKPSPELKQHVCVPRVEVSVKEADVGHAGGP